MNTVSHFQLPLLSNYSAGRGVLILHLTANPKTQCMQDQLSQVEHDSLVGPCRDNEILEIKDLFFLQWLAICFHTFAVVAGYYRVHSFLGVRNELKENLLYLQALPCGQILYVLAAST